MPHQSRWWVDRDRLLGRVRVNLRLNDELTDFGGHRRVIERNGGVLDDISPAGRLRYWCRTS